MLGLVDRPTRDLDYFGTTADAVDRLRPALERALHEAGLRVEVRRAVPGFVEFEIADASEGTSLDLSWDTRLHAPQQTTFGTVLARDELAADKTLALFGRGEARDFVDVHQLRAHYSREDLYRLAQDKDRGFDLRMFGGAIARIDRHDRADFPVDDHTYAALRDEFDDWVESIVASLEVSGPTHDLDSEIEPPGLDL
ncbi:MAG: nucleotidyl transferase AbiEii/AbiGii toxin family protein [Acidimicrobiia bacterium]